MRQSKIADSKFQPAGTLPRPRVIGRAIRFLSGVVLLLLLAQLLARFNSLVGFRTPRNPLFWAALVFAVYQLPDFVAIAFQRPWGRQIQAGTALLAAAVSLADLFLYGRVWGPPLGILTVGLMLLVYGYLALSLIVATVFAAPG